jgi:hypothetical protein
VRKLQSYINKYGPNAGPKLYHALQSQAAHAGVSARLRRKIDVLTGRLPRPRPSGERPASLPLFPEPAPVEAGPAPCGV